MAADELDDLGPDFDPDFDPERTYTEEQRRSMNRTARIAARREYVNDPNRKDPKHVQDRITAATHELRVRMGLET